MKWFKSKKEKEKIKRRKKDLLLTNYIITMFFGFLIASFAHIYGVNIYLYRTENEMTGTMNMNVSVIVVVAFYFLLQAINYGLYIYKKENILKIMMIFDALACLICMILGLNVISYVCFLAPVVNGLMYLNMLKKD